MLFYWFHSLPAQNDEDPLRLNKKQRLRPISNIIIALIN